MVTVMCIKKNLNENSEQPDLIAGFSFRLFLLHMTVTVFQSFLKIWNKMKKTKATERSLKGFFSNAMKTFKNGDSHVYKKNNLNEKYQL